MISLAIDLPSVHLVIGEHGSGKTTLARMLCGEIEPENGSLIVGETVHPHIDRQLMRRLGIFGVHDRPAIVESLKLVDDFFLPTDSLSLFPRLFRRSSRVSQLRTVFAEYGVDLDPMASVASLDAVQRLKFELVRAGVHTRSALVLDDFFERISESQSPQFFEIVRHIAASGTAVIIFTEKTDELYDLADKISIIRDGKLLITERVGNLARLHILRLTYSQLKRYNPVDAARRNFTQLLKYNEAILHSLPVNLLVTGPDKRLEIVNRSAQDFFAIDPAHSYQQPFETLFDEGNEEILALLEEAMDENEPQSFMEVPLKVGGQSTVAAITTFPIIDGQIPIGCMVIIEDITEQTRIRSQLGLSERLASVGLLAAGVAHEINTPLSTIRNYLSTMHMERGDGNPSDRFTEIDNQIDYISSIIENLMLFSHSGTGPQQEYDINESIRVLVRFLRTSLRQKNISIKLYLSETPLVLHGFEAEFKQAFMNLLKNSIEAIGNDGEIVVVSERQRVNESDTYRVSIADSGKGFDSSLGERIFYPFFSTKRSGHNFGLGLFVSHQIVESMNGRLIVQSSSGEGCLATIELPA